MSPFVRLVPVICACVVTQAFAVDPPPPSSAKPVDTAPANTKPADTKPADAKPTKIVLEDKTLTNAEVKQLLAAGYKPVGRNGEVLYCRSEEEIGSRFKKTHCKTADQMKQLTQDSKDMAATAQKPNGCGAGGC
jgi:hypothetical protein